MALDSKAVFAMKLKKLNLEDSLNDFIRLGWDTLGKFAFSANYIPGKADDSVFISDVVIPLFQRMTTLLKRLRCAVSVMKPAP